MTLQACAFGVPNCSATPAVLMSIVFVFCFFRYRDNVAFLKRIGLTITLRISDANGLEQIRPHLREVVICTPDNLSGVCAMRRVSIHEKEVRSGSCQEVGEA